jgi:predicted nucleic acid-binding protein
MASERDTIVFDTEPLMAYFHDEPGSDPVGTYIDSIDSGANGFVSRITRIELHHLTARVESGTERRRAYRGGTLELQRALGSSRRSALPVGTGRGTESLD